jgi:hypothetical protein
MSILEQARPEPVYQTITSRLKRLGQGNRPGLAEAEFVQLLARCECGIIVARCVFHQHECLQPERVPQITHPVAVIDLTNESDEE